MRKSIAELTDTELALRAKAGDQSALEAIYERHVAGVARILASFAGPDGDVLSDLVQTVFLRVIDNIDRYRPTAPFGKWLYTVALNVGRNHVRAKHKTVSVEPDRLESLAGDPVGHNPARRDHLAARAFRIVAGLPEGTRAVVALRVGSGLSYVEIGDALGIPEGTARRRMHEAIKILRERMGLTLSGKEGRDGRKFEL